MSGREHNRATILVADDEPSVLGLMTTVLRALGHDVLPAPGGDEALRVFESRAGAVDLLLTDIRMEPSMNGDELARRIRGLRPETPVLFVSGHTHGHEAVAREVLEHKALFLAKPFTPSTLGRMVEEALSLASA